MALLISCVYSRGTWVFSEVPCVAKNILKTSIAVFDAVDSTNRVP